MSKLLQRSSQLNVCTTVVILLCGLLTWFAGGFWLADLAANLRLQLIIAGVASGFLGLLLRQRKCSAIQAALLVMHSTWLIHPAAYAQTKSGPAHITVTTANVWLFNERFNEIADVLVGETPDVIAIVEIREPLLNHLKQRLSTTHPHVFARPARNAFGVALFSRTQLINPEVIQAEGDAPSLTARVEVSGRQYRVFATHPMSPMSKIDFERRNRQLLHCADALRQYRQNEPDVPIVTVGDFNVTPWSPHFVEFQKDSGLLLTGSSWGIRPTWYAAPAFPGGLVIDHCLVTPDLSCVDHIVGPNIGSDHRPVTARLQLNDDSATQLAERNPSVPVGLATTRRD